MKLAALIVTSLFTFSNGYADVLGGTDVGKRSVKSHNQVTRCEGDSCTLNSITRFNKSVDGKHMYYGDCNFSEEGNVRFKHCKITNKRKSRTVIKEKTVKVKVDNTLNNRLQLHLGYGVTGINTESNNNNTTVSEEQGLIVGLQYTRRLEQEANIGVAIFSNEMATMVFGLDF